MPKPTCIIATALWGEWHVQAFLQLNIPTMLAQGNLPALVERVDAVYTIHTTQQDWDRLSADSRFRQMGELLDVRFSLLEAADIGAPTATHHRVWQSAIADASRSGGYVILMPPDVAWSDGSLRHIAELMQAGKKALFLNWHVRSVENTFVDDFRQRYAGTGAAIAVPARDLVRLSLEHVHPMTGAYLRSSPCFPHHPEMIFWAVEGEGLLMRVLALVPFVFRPDQIELTPQRTVAATQTPADVEFVVDSDDLYMVSLTEIGKDADWYKANIPLDPIEVARWWLYYDSPVNDQLARANYRLHFAQPTPGKWRQAENAARLCMHRLLATREMLRVRAAAQRMGCWRAASILDYALTAGLAPAIVGHEKPLAIFLPEDGAFAHCAQDLEALMRPAHHRELIGLLRSHLMPAERLPAEASVPVKREHCRTESGEWIEIEITPGLSLAGTGGAGLAGISAGRHMIYATPRLLAEPRVKRWQLDRDDPDLAGRTLLEALAEGADRVALARLMDALRRPGIEGTLIQALLAALGRPHREYRGFDHLSGTTRATMLGNDPWHWHRTWLDSALPDEFKARLACDLAFTSTSAVESERIADRALVPKPIAQVALGRLLVDHGRVGEGMALFRRAGDEDASFGMVMRHAGEAAYRAGEGTVANEWFHMSLHTDDWEAFDLAAARARGSDHTTRFVRDYYGIDYHTRGSDFIAVQTGVDTPFETSINAIKSQIARTTPTAWLYRNLPRDWVLRIRDLVIWLADLPSRIPNRLRRLREYREKAVSENGKHLLALSRRIKAAAGPS